jgi:MFS family permease
VQGLSWQWVFWCNVPIGIAAIVLVPRVIAESYGPRRPVDLASVALASGGLLALVWAIISANGSGWASPQHRRPATTPCCHPQASATGPPARRAVRGDRITGRISRSLIQGRQPEPGPLITRKRRRTP